jgi:hypothetical protein
MMVEQLTDVELKQKLEEFVDKYHADQPEVELFEVIKERLERARGLHPRFAENTYHALGFLSEEHGEAIREATKGMPDWESRMDSELLDLIVVAIRIILREYEHEE